MEYIANYNIKNFSNQWHESTGPNFKATIGFHHYKNRFKNIYYGSRGGRKRKGASWRTKAKIPNHNYNHRPTLLKYKENLGQVSVIDLLRAYYPDQLKSNPVYFSTKDKIQQEAA